MALKDEKRGPLRKLLGKVVERVVDVALGTSRPPPPPAAASTTAREGRDRPRARNETTSSAPPTRELPEPTPSFEDVEPVEVSAEGDGAVRLCWTLTDDALDRARRVLGDDGELRARLIVVARDDERVVASRIHEKSGVESQGEWLVRDIPEGARCAAAVGVSRGGRFVSAAHARVLSL